MARDSASLEKVDIKGIRRKKERKKKKIGIFISFNLVLSSGSFYKRGCLQGKSSVVLALSVQIRSITDVEWVMAKQSNEVIPAYCWLGC